MSMESTFSFAHRKSPLITTENWLTVDCLLCFAKQNSFFNYSLVQGQLFPALGSRCLFLWATLILTNQEIFFLKKTIRTFHASQILAWKHDNFNVMELPELSDPQTLSPCLVGLYSLSTASEGNRVWSHLFFCCMEGWRKQMPKEARMINLWWQTGPSQTLQSMRMLDRLEINEIWKLKIASQQLLLKVMHYNFALLSKTQLIALVTFYGK